MKQTILFLIYLVLALPLMAQQVNIVPQPTAVKMQSGTLALAAVNGYSLHGVTEAEIGAGLEELKAEIIAAGFDFEAFKKAPVKAGIPTKDTAFRELCIKNGLLKGKSLSSQGYEIKIDEKQVLIAAQSGQGIFYALQSLKQLVRGAENKQIPCVKIFDEPAFEFRGVMDDISRGPVPSTEYLKYQIRRAAELKLNNFTYYIEHMVRTIAHPEFAPGNGAISIEEWKELSDYARRYHVQLVGSFQSLGHYGKILSHPKFRHLGASNQMLFPGADKSIEFLADIYKEMAPAFSSNYFNVNCDEVWDLGRGSTKQIVDSLGIARVYAKHINRIDLVLKQENKQMMIWGDIALSHPEVLDMIPKETILLTWEYGNKDSFAEWIDPIKDKDLRFMVCPGVLNSNRLFPDLEMATGNIRNFIGEGFEKGAIGVLNTIWDDGGRHSFNRDWYGVAYGADQSWNPSVRDVAMFDEALSNGVYGDKTASLPKAIHSIMSLKELAATQELNNQVFWNTMIPERGKQVTYKMSDWAEVLKIATEVEQILNDSHGSAYNLDVDYVAFTVEQYRYLAEGHIQLLQAANAYSKACVNQFSAPEKAKEELQQAVMLVTICRDRFHALSEKFEKLWNKENRAYWSDYAMDPYLKLCSDYDDLQLSLETAESMFKQQKALPYPHDIRLDIREQEGDYFQYWLLCGAFHVQNEEGKVADMFEATGGEAQVHPIPGSQFTAPSGKMYHWQKYASPYLSKIDFKEIYQKNTECVAYAYCRIESKEDSEVLASFGSNDGIEVFCNGEQVFSKRMKRDLIVDEDRCLLPLQAGKNHVLLKIDNWKGGWAFSFRLPEVKIRHHKYKYEIIEE